MSPNPGTLLIKNLTFVVTPSELKNILENKSTMAGISIFKDVPVMV